MDNDGDNDGDNENNNSIPTFITKYHCVPLDQDSGHSILD